MNNATTSDTYNPNGANGVASEPLTSAQSIGSSAGVVAAKATDIAHTAQEYGQKIADAAVQATSFVTDKAALAGDKIKELQNIDFGELAESAKSYARRKPTQTILISAAVGLLLGLVIRGRR
jgi:hypothetical protein